MCWKLKYSESEEKLTLKDKCESDGGGGRGGNGAPGMSGIGGTGGGGGAGCLLTRIPCWASFIASRARISCSEKMQIVT